MARKCYISFKTEDIEYKDAIQSMGIDMVDKSMNEPYDSYDEDYIMQQIRKDYLSDSTVTIHLIGEHSAENKGKDEQKFIKRELQASLYDGKGNTRSGILGIVLPSMYNTIYTGPYDCRVCHNEHNGVAINDATTIKEFSCNYYIAHDKCSWSYDQRYCVLVKWDDFKLDPEKYIEQAFEKREHDIAKKVTVYPK